MNVPVIETLFCNACRFCNLQQCLSLLQSSTFSCSQTISQDLGITNKWTLCYHYLVLEHVFRPLMSSGSPDNIITPNEKSNQWIWRRNICLSHLIFIYGFQNPLMERCYHNSAFESKSIPAMPTAVLCTLHCWQPSRWRTMIILQLFMVLPVTDIRLFSLKQKLITPAWISFRGSLALGSRAYLMNCVITYLER